MPKAGRSNKKVDREKIASSISAIMNAPLITLATFIPLVLKFGNGNIVNLLIITGFFGFILPMIGVVTLLKMELISDFYATKRNERFVPFLTTIFSYLLGTIYLIMIKAPGPITALMACYLVNGIVLALITLKWKISIHASGVTSPITALVYLLGTRLAPLFILVLPVIWARLELNAHSKMQLTAGAILSTALTWFQMAWYVQHVFI
jgi:membrane-associated phospholipid phosphatase